MIALEHQTIAVDVDLALAVDQSRRRCAKPGNDLLTTQNVIARAGQWFGLGHHLKRKKDQQSDCEYSHVVYYITTVSKR